MARHRSLALLVVASVLGTAPAYAQSDSDKATARALGQQGEAALDGSRWKEAEDFFRRADALFHAPTLTLGLARAEAHEGKFVESWESYHRIIIENVTAPPVFAKALADAQAELASVEGQRARLTITVTGSPAPRVTINDVPVRVEALGVPRLVDPGHTVVTVAGDGLKTETRTIELAPGKDESVSIALVKDDASPVASTSPAPEAPPAADAGGGSFYKPAAIGAFAVGGAGLVLGAITGAVALGKHSDLKTECPSGSCDTTASQSTLSSYKTMGALSTVGFIVGGVGVGGGVVLLVLAPKAPSAAKTGTTFQPYVGFGTVGATGTF
jgi:hypothetical protein